MKHLYFYSIAVANGLNVVELPVYFKDRLYGFDDGLYAAARLIEILSKSNDVTNALKMANKL